MKGNAMNELEAWQQGHSSGVNLAVKLINEWCEFECKTIAEVIQVINQMKEMAHD
jgi:hypothetical protein